MWPSACVCVGGVRCFYGGNMFTKPRGGQCWSGVNTEEGIKTEVGQNKGNLTIQGFVGQNKEFGLYTEHNQAPLGGSVQAEDML